MKYEIKKWRHVGECCVCEKPTDWTCPECSMYASAKVWLCPNRECRQVHHAMCGVKIAAN